MRKRASSRCRHSPMSVGAPLSVQTVAAKEQEFSDTIPRIWTGKKRDAHPRAPSAVEQQLRNSQNQRQRRNETQRKRFPVTCPGDSPTTTNIQSGGGGKYKRCCAKGKESYLFNFGGTLEEQRIPKRHWSRCED